MLAIGLHAFERGARLVRNIAVDGVEDQFGIAEDRIERRAQLVAHVGEELRLVLARQRELLALLADLGEQPRVLDRQHRLGGERVQQVDRALRKFARRLAAHHQRADDRIGMHQRHQQARAVAGLENDLVDRRRRCVAQIGYLLRLTARDRRRQPHRKVRSAAR